MSFESQLRGFAVQTDTAVDAVFVVSVQEATRSIVEGSEITGAAGQPVGQYGPGYHPGEVGGTLKASWHTVFLSKLRAIIGTNLKYAEPIEDGVGAYGPLTLRSTVGGFHSLKRTIAGWPRIVVHANRLVGGGG